MNWSFLRNKWVVRAGYVALGMVSFLYFFVHGFPFDRLVRSYVPLIEKEAGLKVEFASLRPGWLHSLVATDVRISSVARRGIGVSAAPAAAEEPALRIEKLRLWPRPLSLLSGRLGLGVDGLIYGGRVNGFVRVGRSTSDIDLAISNIELAKYPGLSRYQVNVAGQVNGTVDLTMVNDDASKSSGKIDIAIKNAVINESNPYNIQKIPTTPFERGGAAVIVVKDGKAEFQDVGLHGEALDVSLEGELALRKKLVMSQWSAKAAIRMSEPFKSAVPLIDPFLAPGKGTDGTYRYRLSGMLTSPRTLPDRSK